MSLERYTKATQSSDLAWREWEIRSIDWLTIAAGLAKVNPLACAVARLLAHPRPNNENDLMGMERWRLAWNAALTELMRPYGIRLERQGQIDMEAALNWYDDDKCAVCRGRAHPVENDAPILKEEDCLACHGTGRAPHITDSVMYATTLKRLGQADWDCRVWWREHSGEEVPV